MIYIHYLLPIDCKNLIHNSWNLVCFVKTENQDRIKDYTSGISNDLKKKKEIVILKRNFFFPEFKRWIKFVNEWNLLLRGLVNLIFHIYIYYTSKSTVALKWARFQKKPSVVLSLLWHTVRLNLNEGDEINGTMQAVSGTFC